MILMLLIEALLDNTRGKKIFFHIEVIVVGDEYLSQLINFGLVVKLEGVSIAQPFLNLIPCLTFDEEIFVGLPLEGIHCHQEFYDIPKIFLEVLSKEVIHNVKYSSFSLIIEMNVKVLRNFPFFLFFLVSIVIPSGIYVFEEFDECVDICGLF